MTNLTNQAFDSNGKSVSDSKKSDTQISNRKVSNNISNYEKIEKRTRVRNNIRNTVIYFFLCLWALIVLFPFYWMVLTSVKSYGSYNAEYIPKFFTLSPTLQNYVDAFTTVSLGRYLWNTLFFTVVTTAIMLVVITLAAFAFARLNFAGKI